MMQENEILALIGLLDDNDPEIFDHVSSKLFSMGSGIIDKLEDAYTIAQGNLMQERIEDLIHRIQLEGVEKDLESWCKNEQDDLLKGILIITRHQYPDLDEEKVIKSIARIKKDIWIGLNNYLSPLEQMNIFNQTIFSHYQFLSLQNTDDELRYCYLNNTTESLKGSHFTIGILYLILCQQLEMPVYGVCLNTHFILARSKDYISDFSLKDKIRNEVLFYINPYNKGLAFSDREINTYLKKLHVELKDDYYLPASNKTVLIAYLNYLVLLYNKPDNAYKVDDLNKLIMILSEED